jgi:hypothetical protein
VNEPPRPLDPIVSLAVALAESPGTYAFFLGSGVSHDAGVSTGAEVLAIARNDLYRLENPDKDALDTEAVDAWLQATKRDKLNLFRDARTYRSGTRGPARIPREIL